MSKGQLATGTVEGTGSAINVSCGFTPKHITLINIDGDARLDWNDQYADGTGYKIIAAGTGALIGSNGITPYSGSSGSAAKGFTIGTDSDVNASGETINWTAWGED